MESLEYKSTVLLTFFFKSNPCSYRPIYISSLITIYLLAIAKVVMQGKLIAVAYTLRSYRNQFSLGGICKQEQMQQCSFSIEGG